MLLIRFYSIHLCEITHSLYLALLHNIWLVNRWEWLCDQSRSTVIIANHLTRGTINRYKMELKVERNRFYLGSVWVIVWSFTRNSPFSCPRPPVTREWSCDHTHRTEHEPDSHLQVESYQFHHIQSFSWGCDENRFYEWMTMGFTQMYTTEHIFFHFLSFCSFNPSLFIYITCFRVNSDHSDSRLTT